MPAPKNESDYSLEFGKTVLCYRGLPIGGQKLLEHVQRLERRIKRKDGARKKWCEKVRIAFMVNQDTPPSIAYMLEYSIRHNIPFSMPEPSWSFSADTVKILFDELNQIDDEEAGIGLDVETHGGPKTPPTT